MNHSFPPLSALRVHVSPECKSVLDEIGGYKTEERGNVTMKVSDIPEATK